jgi:hypothetical protein
MIWLGWRYLTSCLFRTDGDQTGSLDRPVFELATRLRGRLLEIRRELFGGW